MKKLERLLADLAIDLRGGHMDAIKNARNSLVHSGGFVTSENNEKYSEYRNLMLLGRSILLRLVGVPSTLHEEMEG